MSANLGRRLLELVFFWSGASGQAKWGLEVSDIAVIDIKEHTALHLEAVQIPGKQREISLANHYGNILVERKEQLLSLSKHVVADAYFSKQGFTSKLADHDFELVSRLRDDAHLIYKYLGSQKKGRGRPKKYDGKVRYDTLAPDHFTCLADNEACEIYQGNVFSKSLKREINLVVVKTLKKGSGRTSSISAQTLS